VSTPEQPDVFSKGDIKTFGKVLHGSWERHCSGNEEETTLETSTTTEQNETPPQPPPPSPPQPPAATTPTTRTVSPSTASPKQLKDNSDLLDFFGSIIGSECSSKEDLFRLEVTSEGLRAKLVAFGKSLAADGLVKHYQDFYDTSVPVNYTIKDTSELEPCPCLWGKHRIPMSLPAITEVVTAIHKIAEQVPEVLHLPKCGGAKGHGKRLVAVVPSSDKHRLYPNAKLWMETIIENATTDETSTFDIIKALIRVLHAFDSLAFEQVVADVPQVGHAHLKLDAELQQAMVFATNLNLSQMRTIKSHLCCADLDTFQPESVMRKLQVTEFVKPMSLEFKDGGTRKRPSWCVPVDDLLVWHAMPRIGHA